MPIVALATASASPTRFGPNEALDLAVLGVAGHGAIDAEDLLASVGSLGGPAWQPCGDSVLSSLERLVRHGYIVAQSGHRSSHPLIFRITAAGLDHLRKLLRTPPAGDFDQLGQAGMVLKIAFFDFLPRTEQCVRLDCMIEALQRKQAELLAQSRRTFGTAPHLRLAYRRQHERLADDVAWLWSIRAGLS